MQSSLPRRRREQRSNDDVRLVPGPPRFTWESTLEDVRCRHNHATGFSFDKLIVTTARAQQRKRLVARFFDHCDVCRQRGGETTYQVGFWDGRRVRWYAIPDARAFDEMQGWRGDKDEDETWAILQKAWNIITSEG
jgi:hypothetical protein